MQQNMDFNSLKLLKPGQKVWVTSDDLTTDQIITITSNLNYMISGYSTDPNMIEDFDYRDYNFVL